jgi:fibro-slime domain-containing protein
MKGTSVIKRSVGAAGLLGALGLAATLGSSSAVTGAQRPTDPYGNLPAQIQLTGVIRDFREVGTPGGHADFERGPTRGFAHYMQQCNDALDADGKPVFRGTGKKVTTEWKDSASRPMMQPRAYIATRSGDQAGALETQDGGSTTSAANFAQWYRDVPGVNMSAPLAITLVRNPNTNMYTFNDQTDAHYRGLGGFFPINGELFGNSGGSTPNQNFHFTYELSTTFVYQRGTGQIFTFTGDDDVWVFVDGKMVIDLGGVHGATSQTIDLDRLNWLETGHRYSLKIFQAERHRTQSNFRMDTTITLEPAQLPTTSALYD